MIVDGTRLRFLREQQAVTMQELADRAGVRVCTVESLEFGNVRARVRVVMRLARALNVEPGTLLRQHPSEDVDDGTVSSHADG